MYCNDTCPLQAERHKDSKDKWYQCWFSNVWRRPVNLKISINLFLFQKAKDQFFVQQMQAPLFENGGSMWTEVISTY